MFKIMLFGGCLFIGTQMVWAGGLERLFTTTEERTELNKLREHPPEPEEEIKIENQKPKPPPQITFNGLVTRSDGKTIVWMNGSEELFRPGFNIAVEKRDGIVVPIVLSRAGQEIGLKPGETVNTLDGKVFENYAPYSPVSKPSPEQKTSASEEEKVSKKKVAKSRKNSDSVK